MGVNLRELSIFLDESGIQEGGSEFYLVTFVLHDQADDVEPAIARYEESLAVRGLPDIPFHATPLMRASAYYEGMDMATRKALLSSFGIFVQRVPVRYRTFVYESKEFDGPQKLAAFIRRDLVSFVVDELEFFQSFDKVKIYYDDGQPAVSSALRDAIAYSLSKEAVLYRKSDYRSYRLSQVADYLCCIELANAKFAVHHETQTDVKFFGGVRAFKKNYLKQARRKRF